MKFMLIVWAAFLARQNPVSTMAKPACMNMTRKPASSVQTMLIDDLVVADGVHHLGQVGAAGFFTGTSLAVPVVAPVGSLTGAAGLPAPARTQEGWLLQGSRQIAPL